MFIAIGQVLQVNLAAAQQCLLGLFSSTFSAKFPVSLPFLG
jgi:hypothetical protein